MISGQRNQVSTEPIAPQRHFQNDFLSSQILPIDDKKIILTPLSDTVLILSEFTQLSYIFTCQYFRLCCGLYIVGVGRSKSTEYDPWLRSQGEIIPGGSNNLANTFVCDFYFFGFFKHKLAVTLESSNLEHCNMAAWLSGNQNLMWIS